MARDDLHLLHGCGGAPRFIFAAELSVRLISCSYGLYLIGSLCDCLAVNFPMLIIGRVLEALGTGVLMPLLQTIAMTRFPENRHGTAMGIAGIALGFAPNIGPVVGGALCTAFSWRAMFLILACASAVLIVCALAVVREREVKDAAAHLDVTSLVFSTFGFGGLLLGFTAAANIGLTEPLVGCRCLWESRARRIVRRASAHNLRTIVTCESSRFANIV